MLFFLARRVVSRTSGEEFHSLNATAMRWERSHWLNSESCVDFPEPSIPSTTISLPRWRFGTRRGIERRKCLLYRPGKLSFLYKMVTGRESACREHLAR